MRHQNPQNTRCCDGTLFAKEGGEF